MLQNGCYDNFKRGGKEIHTEEIVVYPRVGNG
jgi:hypothetical protein